MRQRGFSLLEMLVVVFVFTVITGAVFGLLNVSQQRYKMESEFLDSFQSARLGLDQMTRDIHTAGYPPVVTLPPAVACASPQLVAYPFAWSPGYLDPNCLGVAPIQCAVGGAGGCTIPGPFDLITEADVDPENTNGVEWVRYRLNQATNTLERGVASKVAGGNPAVATLAVMIPYVENVMNSTTAAEMGQIQASHPLMFPGNLPVPIFQYVFDVGGTTPGLIREINITLIVRAPNPDPRTNQLRVLTLTGLARRFNPS